MYVLAAHDLIFVLRLETAIPLLKQELARLDQTPNVAIAFPDDGAHKRFHSLFTDYPTIICHKIRNGKERIVKVKDGNNSCD